MGVKVLVYLLDLVLAQTVDNLGRNFVWNLRNQQVKVVNSVDLLQNLSGVLYKSLLVNVNKQVEVKSVSSDDFKSLEVQFLVHFILDLIDHNELGVDSFKVSSGKLQYKSAFGASDNFGPSFDISNI